MSSLVNMYITFFGEKKEEWREKSKEKIMKVKKKKKREKEKMKSN